MTNVMDNPDGATPLDPDELEGLKFKHVSTRSELDQLEQAAITEGMTWLSNQKNPDVLSEAFVRKLHKNCLVQFGNGRGRSGKQKRI